LIRERCGGVLNFLTPLAALTAGGAVMAVVEYAAVLINAAVPFFTGDNIIDSLYITFLSQIIGAGVVYVVLIPLTGVKHAEHRPVSIRSLRTTLLSLMASISVSFAVALALVTLFLSIGVSPETGYGGTLYLEPRHLSNVMNIVIFYAVGSLGAPLYEELLYRRLPIPLMEARGASPMTAIVVSTVMFGMVHLPLDLFNGNVAGAVTHFASVAATGLFLGFVYVVTRNVLFSMLVHGIVNGISFTISVGGISPTLVNLQIAALLVYLALAALGLVVIIRAWGQYRRQPPVRWVQIVNRKGPSCTRRGSAWLLVLFAIVLAAQLLIELAAVLGTAHISRIASVGAGLAVNAIVLLTAIILTTRTEVVHPPVSESQEPVTDEGPALV